MLEWFLWATIMENRAQRYLGPITQNTVNTPGSLEYREHVLNRRMLDEPSTLAQRVEVELIKNLEINAPWLMQQAMMRM